MVGILNKWFAQLCYACLDVRRAQMNDQHLTDRMETSTELNLFCCNKILNEHTSKIVD